MNKPVVAVLMGSDSDLPIVRETLTILEQFGVAFDIRILSAHRSPAETVSYIKTSEAQGIRVYIAAAGGAAHLAGTIAAHTVHPVIGIPILGKSLDGEDSLFSTVQMPPGVPVATVGINAATNAAILAIQILALNDTLLTKQLKSYKQKLQKGIRQKNSELTRVGWKKYGN
jgi:phosphoribosylaminoimidazole carboxylase PurE protein